MSRKEKREYSESSSRPRLRRFCLSRVREVGVYASIQYTISMSWILVSISSYFFGAVAALLDKTLLSGRIAHPAVYAFFVALFSLFALIIVPFGFQWYGSAPTLVFLVSGGLFLYSLLAFYIAVQQSEVSRVAPLVGTVMALTALVVYYLPVGGDATRLLDMDWISFLAFLLLIGGGILIAFDPSLGRQNWPSGFSLAAGVGMSLSLLLLKYGYATYEANFESGFVWSRLGMFAGGLSLLLVPSFRKHIREGLAHHGRANRDNAKTGVLFALNKVSGGLSAFLMNYATYLGPVVFVQALSGIQFVFLFFLAWLTSTQYPHLFEERFGMAVWVQKAVAIGMIGLGTWLAVLGGARLLV